MEHRLTRRDVLRAGAAAAATALVPACGPVPEVSDEERARLDQRTRENLAASGQGPLGELRFRGYRGMAELPWFELDTDGELVLVDESIPAGIDVHTHLGMAHGFASTPDLQARTPRVLYHLDCDATDPGCPLDLDVYMNLNFTEDELTALRLDAVRGATIGSPRSDTHTLPNLAAEMDRMGFERACVLPIATSLPLRGDATDVWLDAIEASADPGRFIRGGSVHPRSDDPAGRVAELADRGVRILKLHPEAQRFAPDDPDAMAIYEACVRRGLAVIFHAGRSGIEPEAVRPFALPRHFADVFASFPQLPVILGHGGAREQPEMLEVARDHPNALFGISSVGASGIRRMLDIVGPERVVFGSDWAFYPLSAALAKLLLATRDWPEAREPVLRGNLLRAFGAA